jgi:hypothetical protein
MSGWWWTKKADLRYRRPQKLTGGELETLAVAALIAFSGGLVGWWAKGEFSSGAEESSVTRMEPAPRRVWTPSPK